MARRDIRLMEHFFRAGQQVISILVAKQKIIFIDEEELPPKRVFGRAYLKSSWIPWKAVEQIPKGMALEITPWLDGRPPKSAAATLHNSGGRLAIKFPHLHVILRGHVLFIWNPSDTARALAKERGHWRAWQLEA